MSCFAAFGPPFLHGRNRVAELTGGPLTPYDPCHNNNR